MVHKLFTTFIVVAAILASPKHRDFTTELYLIYLEIGLQYLVSQESVRENMAICDAFYVTIFLFLWRTPLA